MQHKGGCVEWGGEVELEYGDGVDRIALVNS